MQLLTGYGWEVHAAVSQSKGELAFVVLQIELWVPHVKSRHDNTESSSPRVRVQAWGCTVEAIFLIGSKDPPHGSYFIERMVPLLVHRLSWLQFPWHDHMMYICPASFTVCQCVWVRLMTPASSQSFLTPGSYPLSWCTIQVMLCSLSGCSVIPQSGRGTTLVEGNLSAY